jgi:tRNA modification GTPase
VSVHRVAMLTFVCNAVRAVVFRLAMQELGKITGRVDVEELLDIIFRDFCIGK